MNKNVKIAKELMKLAKALIANKESIKAYYDKSASALICSYCLGDLRYPSLKTDKLTTGYSFAIDDAILSEYNSFSLPSNSKYKEMISYGGGVFISFMIPISSEEDAKAIADNLGYIIVDSCDDLF